MKQLEFRFGVSRTTIKRDLDEALLWLNQHKLSLIKRPHLGCQVSGEELHVREAIVTLLLKNVDRARLLASCAHSQLHAQPHAASRSPDTYVTAELLRSMRMSYARILVGCLEETLALVLSDDAYVAIVLHIALCMTRAAQGKHAQMASEVLSRLQGLPELEAARMVADRIDQHLDVQLSQGDVGHIAIHLTTARPQERSQPRERSSVDQDEDEAALTGIVTDMIDEASAYLHPWLKVDRQLFDNLMCHIRPAWHRLKFDLPVANPLLKDIQEFDRYVYQVATKCADILASELANDVPPEEIGYIAMHFAASLERIRPPRQARRRILVVCGEGSATAWMLVSRLRAEFPSIEISAVVPTRSVSEFDLSNVDAVVSTLPLTTEKVPVRVVSPFLTAEDVLSVRDLLVISSTAPAEPATADGLPDGPPLCQLVTNGTIALQQCATNWAQAIDKACALLKAIGAVDAQFARAVKELIITHGPYMVSAPGFVLLHTRPGHGVKELAMGLMTFDPPVEFGHAENDPVSVALVLAAVDHQSHRRALRDIVTLIGDDQLLQDLRQASDIDHAFELLAHVSEATSTAQLGD
jgi:transcriptional antiterminator/mannitol/fructose-specific phosphotransferase system IIA component (Ntr-type)